MVVMLILLWRGVNLMFARMTKFVYVPDSFLLRILLHVVTRLVGIQIPLCDNRRRHKKIQ
jgi:hypothetical protein